MRASLAIALAAVAVVVVLRVAAVEDDGIPFVAVRQGVSTYEVDGARTFVVRSGSVVNAYSAASGARGARVQWCPREQLWWAPATNDLFSRSGKRAFGEVNHDLVRYETQLTLDGLLEIDVNRPIVAGPTNGRAEVDKAVFEFYQRYLNYDPSVPTTRRPVWCPDPIR